MSFLKKIFFRANGPFRTKNGTSSQLWICRQDRFTILQNERDLGQKKNVIWGNLVFLAQKWCILITLDLLFFFILHNKRGQELHENFIS